MATSGNPDTSQWARAFAAAGDAERRGAEHHLLERAVGVVGGEQAAEREHRGKQRRHPDHARRDGPQLVRLGADAEREQAHHDDEEQQHGGYVAPPPHRHQQLAPDHMRATASTLELDHAAVAQAGVLVGGVDHAAAALRVLAEQRARQLGRRGVERGERLVEQPDRRLPAQLRRASAARRRWPCESWRTGLSPARRSARARRASARPKARARRARRPRAGSPRR